MAPETRVRSSVATHLLTSLNLPVSSLAPDSNRIPVTDSSGIPYYGTVDNLTNISSAHEG